ncbi:MAG: glycosyl hydrolase family 28 protein [Tepidisphaeraceae bacterium]|jgi:polygalacturonase
MRILCSPRKRSARRRSLLTEALWTAALASPLVLGWSSAQADTAGVNPVAITIGTNVFNVTQSNSSIDSGAVAVPNGVFVNTTVLQDFINYCSTSTSVVNGVTVHGGTVLLPSAASAYITGTLTMRNDVNLEVATGATLQNSSSTATLITTSSSETNVEITGGGVLTDNATSTSGSDMLTLEHITNLLVNGVSIESAPHEHLVTESDNNVTINAITISDRVPTLSNTDGIDFSGNNFLIENSNIADGDDDIVAKPESVAMNTILIQNDVIGVGHGISVGGQTNAGLTNMTVNNITFNGTTNGLRLKAGQGEGGAVSNVSFSNIKMTNVTYPILINSWYNGGDNYGSQELSASELATPAAYNVTFNASNPGDPSVSVNESNNTSLYPFFDNITYTNITATGGSGQVAIIYGLNSTDTNPADPLRNIDTISFNNVSLSGAYGADIYYASNLNLSGLTAAATNGNAENLYGDQLVSVPEPTTAGLLGVFGVMALARRRRGSD